MDSCSRLVGLGIEGGEQISICSLFTMILSEDLPGMKRLLAGR
jgi:hypothetical protein